jgi:probable HAF family extracellular repeat protein
MRHRVSRLCAAGGGQRAAALDIRCNVEAPMHAPTPFPAGRLAAALLATSLTSLSAGAASFTLVDLGLLKIPNAVNGHDDVAADGRHGPLERRDGHWHLLMAFRGTARAINEHGDVAGDNFALPMLWRPGHPGMQLPLPGNASFGLAAGINDALAVVGGFEGADETLRCFEWTPAGGPVDLGFMAEGHFCAANDVNNAGQVTGASAVRPDPDRLTHAFVYDGTFHDLGILPQGDQSLGNAINDRGDVAGMASVPPLDGLHFHAAMWPAGGGIVDLDPDGQFASSVAMAINGAGVIVGAVTVDAKGHEKAARFDGRHAVPLEDEVRDLGGWSLERATGVNDHGEIVGAGRAPDGRAHGFLLQPE